MLNILKDLNFLMAAIFAIAYFYQIVYAVVGLLCRNRKQAYAPPQEHRYAVTICARNEAAVVGDLVESLKRQTYPERLLDIYVLADNCTDDTADCAEKAGARVYRRFDKNRVGKGYALDYLFAKLRQEHLAEGYEGYFVFDADNLIDGHFVEEMNKVFDRGYDVVTSYRNSKNFSANWISAAYSIWFLREARFLNFPRMLMGSNCAVSGTGFLVSDKIIRENGGWPFHTLTEDIEFSADCAARNRKIGYCDKAVVFDEQPVSFRQSWDQRLRWSKGFYQVNARYSLKLLKGMFSGGTHGSSCYDMLMTTAPGMLLSLVVIVFNAAIAVACINQPLFVAHRVVREALRMVCCTGANFYLGLFAYGVLTVLSEWKRIDASGSKKIIYIFTFPIFMFTYVPIAFVALVRKVEWRPIRHSSAAMAKAEAAKAIKVGRS